MTTAVLYDDRFLLHDLPGHPECANRLRAITKALDLSGLYASLKLIQPQPVDLKQLYAVHTSEHIDEIRRLCEQGNIHVDPDTYLVKHSWEAALLSAGAAVQAVDAVVRGRVRNAFAFGRPPGHHATYRRAMGFCLFNNIATAARYAIDVLGLKRVAIVDWDVHHGNGTQDIFYNDGRVLFCSTHASPLYPGTGMIGEMGVDDGFGTTLNIAMPYQVGDEGYRTAFERVILPALRMFSPQLILVSAGYDAHWADPLGPMALSTSGFATLATLVRDTATELCGDKLVCILEGGYDLDALAVSVVATLRVLLGLDPGPDTLGKPRGGEPQIGRILDQIVAVHPLLKV